MLNVNLCANVDGQSLCSLKPSANSCKLAIPKETLIYCPVHPSGSFPRSIVPSGAFLPCRYGVGAEPYGASRWPREHSAFVIIVPRPHSATRNPAARAEQARFARAKTVHGQVQTLPKPLAQVFVRLKMSFTTWRGAPPSLRLDKNERLREACQTTLDRRDSLRLHHASPLPCNRRRRSGSGRRGDGACIFL